MPISATSGRWVDDTSEGSHRTYALFMNLVGLLSLFDQSFAGPIGTLIMWRLKANESDFLDDHGREAMNFQISLLIYSAAAIPIGVATLGFGVPVILFVLAVVRLVGCIRGAMAASRGEYYRYPVCIRFLKPSTPM